MKTKAIKMKGLDWLDISGKKALDRNLIYERSDYDWQTNQYGKYARAASNLINRVHGDKHELQNNQVY